MSRLNNFFEFSQTQGRFLALLAIVAVMLAIFRFGFSRQAEPVEPLTVNFGLHPGTGEYRAVFTLDPNTAPADSLELLPGIGRVLADRIVAYRAEKPFIREIDITDVPGIGAKLYERIRPYLQIRRVPQ